MNGTLSVVVDSLAGPQPREIAVARVFNLGFTVRDQQRMQRHLDELKDITLLRPKRPPLILPVAPWVLTTSNEITVQFDGTSGEVELVVIDDGNDLLVGVGSDHTDRSLERLNIAWSKQVTPNVLAPVLWSWREVSRGWRHVRIESWVAQHTGSEFELYQQGTAGEFWTPLEMVRAVKRRLLRTEGVKVFYCGTLSTESGEFNFGRVFKMRLTDPTRGRSIEHLYTVTVLSEEVAD